jgi:outer membrane immunogenic protein
MFAASPKTARHPPHTPRPSPGSPAQEIHDLEGVNYMRNVAFILAAATALVATPAMAEGFRAEIHGGWDHGDINGLGNDDGFLYGVAVGYDLPVSDKMFVGLEAGIDDSTQKDCAGSVVVANDSLCISSGRDLSAVARLGYNVSEQGKLYVLAGYTNARLRSTYTTGATTTKTAGNADGFRVGAGYQHALTDNLYGKVEYRYSNYEGGYDRHQTLVGFGLTF